MARYINARKDEVGLSPYELQFRGVKKNSRVRMRLINYDMERMDELELEEEADAFAHELSKPTSWLNIDGLHDESILANIAEGLELDPLITSDILNTYSRPKVKDYGNCIYISIKMLQYDEEENDVTSENLVIIVKENLLITFQEREGDVFNPLRERIRRGKRLIRKAGTEYLAFAILDIVFDNYKYILSLMGDQIETLEEELLGDPRETMLEEINGFKKEILFLSKTIKPCREMAIELGKLDSPLLSKKMNTYLGDLRENINQTNESLDSYREILSDQLNIYHTTVSSKLNDVMKFLTVFSVVFIPLTFIAGIYGTNFEYVPELGYRYSYFVMWGVMFLLAGLMIWYFKRKRWL